MGRSRGKHSNGLQRRRCLRCGKGYEARRGYAIHLAKMSHCRAWARGNIGRLSTVDVVVKDVETIGSDSDHDGHVDVANAGIDRMLVAEEEVEIPLPIDVDELSDAEDEMGCSSPTSDFSRADLRPPVPPMCLPSRMVTKVYPNAGADFGIGKSFFEILEERDPPEWTRARGSNPYWPFDNEEEWELALWMVDVGLSHSDITSFLKLKYVCAGRFDNVRLRIDLPVDRSKVAR